MPDLQEFLYSLMENGATATVNLVSGDACPCVGSRGISREWHRLHPTAPDCQGKGIINGTTTEKTVKAFFSNTIQTLATFKMTFQKLPIGEDAEADLYMIGTIDSSDGSFFDLSNLSENKDKIIFQGNEYIIRRVYDIWTDERIAQIALLKQIE